jgi:hypothetical protein
MILDLLSRDNLDENGGGNLEIEAAAGSGAMIMWCSKLCKHFFLTSLLIVADCVHAAFDCRRASIRASL